MDGQLQKMVLWYLVVGKAELERRMSCTTDDGQLLVSPYFFGSLMQPWRYSEEIQTRPCWRFFSTVPLLGT